LPAARGVGSQQFKRRRSIMHVQVSSESPRQVHRVRRWLWRLAAVAVLGGCGGGDDAPARVPGVSVYAGSVADSGSADGAAEAARFSSPNGLAFDGSGNLYVADQRNSTIRKITPAGQVSTVAGSPGLDGKLDGTGAAARFELPTGLALDAGGNLLIADAYNLLVRRMTAAGQVSTVASVPFGANDGRSAGQFVVGGVAGDPAGNVYATNGVGTRRIAPNGDVTIIEGVDHVDGMFGTRSFDPRGITTDKAGNVYVADLALGISKAAPGGALVSLAGNGSLGNADGSPATSSFSHPAALAVDSTGNIYVADTGSNSIRKVAPDGHVQTVVGAAVGAGPLGHAVASPKGIAIDSQGDLYVTSGQAVLKITLPAP
jgi:sugar lactone lactonase YvrE